MAIRAGGKEAYTGLLKHLFAVLDNEVASSRQFGEFVSLDAPVEPDAQDVAEAMVEEEIFEFYQHDDTLKLADISLAVSIPMSQRSRNRRS